jgi:hypothetical protein
MSSVLTLAEMDSGQSCLLRGKSLPNSVLGFAHVS